MFSNHTKLIKWVFVISVFLLSFSCKTEDFIVPKEGYNWPENVRDYWPTDSWRSAPMNEHNIDPSKMNQADQFAEKDDLARALLVVKDGYIVFENYYGEGGVNESTNVWSVAKSYTSALIGILIDQNTIKSTDQLMAELLPAYPEFNDIKLNHVLTQTTGLSWVEYGPLWVDWILSDDWVASALARGQVNKPGKKFFYSSANSHFLTSLVYYINDKPPGLLAKEHLFDPMGISFNIIDESISFASWDDYLKPLNQTWMQDSKGIETASFGLFLSARDMAKFGFLYLNKGKWNNQQLISESWVETSTKEQITNIYGRYSYGYQWYITNVGGQPTFLASGFGGQIIGIVPSLDLVVVLKYEAVNAVHPESGTNHDDMHLFELVVNAVQQ